MHGITRYAAALAILAVLMAGMACVVVGDNDDTDAASTYNVYYVVGDVTYKGDPSEGSVTLTTLDDLGASAPAGKTFMGWSDGTDVYDAGTIITIETNTIFTALFEDATYTVTFIYLGTEAVMVYGYQDAVDVPTVTAPTGYTFNGWSDGSATYEAVPAVTGNATYVAVFSVTEVPVVVTYYTVTFMVGDAVYTTETVASGDDAILPYIDGYVWSGYEGDIMTGAVTGNMTVTAIATSAPAVDDNTIAGIDASEFYIYLAIALIIIFGALIIAYKMGFLKKGAKE